MLLLLREILWLLSVAALYTIAGSLNANGHLSVAANLSLLKRREGAVRVLASNEGLATRDFFYPKFRLTNSQFTKAQNASIYLGRALR